MTQASRELGTELTTFEMLTVVHGIVTAWTDFKGASRALDSPSSGILRRRFSAITTTTQWIAANRGVGGVEHRRSLCGRLGRRLATQWLGSYPQNIGF